MAGRDGGAAYGTASGRHFVAHLASYNGRALALRQSKTGARVYIPCTTALRTMLDGVARRDAVTILTTRQGRPWTSDGFKKAWAKTTADPVFEDLHFHDLRGTAVTMLSEAGCSVPEIATITGHTLACAQRILDSYLSRTRPLAESAIAKLEEHPRNRVGKRVENDPKN